MSGDIGAMDPALSILVLNYYSPLLHRQVILPALQAGRPKLRTVVNHQHNMTRFLKGEITRVDIWTPIMTGEDFNEISNLHYYAYFTSRTRVVYH